VTTNNNYSLKLIAELTNSNLIGDGSAIVNNISAIQNSNPGSITFLSNKKYLKYLKQTKASAVIISSMLNIPEHGNYLVNDDPYLAFAKITKLFKKEDGFHKGFHIHPSAVIADDVFIHESAIIGPNVFIGQGCNIGANVIIKANCSLAESVIIEENTTIHHNTVLGSDGFGYASMGDKYEKIEQLGKLIIGSNVEIGAGCTIDRGAIEDTEIHDGVKLDNNIHIAHNVILGANSAIAASCAIAGSSVIGKNFKMGGLSGVLGHLSIADNVTVGAHTLITKNITKSGNYIGIMPAQEHKDWAKSSIFIKKRGN
jgi:UDP-3-O-[3-hydroxymyristoyl] glucosamine N-acyltransferase